jgi:hypothetical protein
VQASSSVGDPNWFYSTLAQSSAAIVGLAGGFMVSRVLAQRSDLAVDRSVLRGQMQNLQADASRQIQDGQRISDTLREALPAARGTQRLDVSQLETFSHPGNHGEVEVHAADTQSLELVEGIAADAIEYKNAFTKLANDEKTFVGQPPHRPGRRRLCARMAK